MRMRPRTSSPRGEAEVMKRAMWVVLSILLASLAMSPDSTAQTSSKIAFVSMRDGNPQISGTIC